MASTAVFASRAEDGLAVVAAGGYLPFSGLGKLEYTCLYMCEEARRHGARKVRVTEATPRTLWCRADDTSASSGARGLNMYPMVEALLFTEIKSRSNANDCGNAFTRKGNGGDSDEAQKRGAELQAIAGEGREAASQTTTTGEFSRTSNAVDERAACSAGDGGGANLVVTRPTALPTVVAGSLVASRVPSVRVTSISWALPTTELTTRDFRWRDGVEKTIFEGVVRKHGHIEPPVVLKFGDGSTRPLKPGCVPLPPGLKKTYFAHCEWNIDLHGARESWPDSIEVLALPSRFNQPLTGGGVGLPRGLRVLELGRRFDQPLVGVEWPPLLRSLKFPIRYSQSFEGIRFPAGLRNIFYKGRAIRGINRAVWPEGLEIIELGLWFNEALVSPFAERGAPPSRKHTLPAGLKKLDLGSSFNQPLSGSELPDGLELLSLGYAFDFLSSVWWPSGLKELCLECARVGDRIIDEDGNPLPIGLPPNLESLVFGDGFNLPLTAFAFPPTLKMLKVGRAFDHPIGGKYGDAPVLPDGLEELRLGLRFNRSLEKIRLPVGLKRLIMTSDIFGEQNQSLAGVMWPPGLEELATGKKFNAPMEGVAFPETLRELSFGRAFARPLRGVGLPDRLTRLSLGPHYPACFLQELKWPRSLRSLHVHSSRFSCREDLARWIVQLG